MGVVSGLLTSATGALFHLGVQVGCISNDSRLWEFLERFASKRQPTWDWPSVFL